MFWDRSKSVDEADTLQRHFLQRGTRDTDGIRHSAKMAWRALAILQKEIEQEQVDNPVKGIGDMNLHFWWKAPTCGDRSSDGHVCELLKNHGNRPHQTRRMFYRMPLAPPRIDVIVWGSSGVPVNLRDAQTRVCPIATCRRTIIAKTQWFPTKDAFVFADTQEPHICGKNGSPWVKPDEEAVNR